MSTSTILSDAWEAEAERWVKWARKPDHDSYWLFHRDQFLAILPAPGKQTVDVGCGEGRLTRHLQEIGHKTVGVDVSKTLIGYAKEADPAGRYELANAASLPLKDGSCDLAIAFMSLQDVDDLDTAVSEIGRVLSSGGRLCLAIVHPINSAGKFEETTADSKFVIEGKYLGEHNYSDTFDRDGLSMTFHSRHRPLEVYSRALEQSSFIIERIREHPIPDERAQSPASRRWQRLPLFMHIRALKLD